MATAIPKASAKKNRRKYSIIVSTSATKKLQANHQSLWYPEKKDKDSYTKALQELVVPLKEGLKTYFENVEIQAISECPDLSNLANWGQFKLASKGISGSTRLADVGGVPYMMDPKYNRTTFQLPDIVKTCQLEVGLVFGAGAASPTVVGKNAELMPNTLVPGPRHTYYAKMEIPRRESGDLEDILATLKMNNKSDNIGAISENESTVVGSKSTDSKNDDKIKDSNDTNDTNKKVNPISTTNDNSKDKIDASSDDNELKVDSPILGDSDSKTQEKSFAKSKEIPFVGVYPSEETGCLANLFICEGKIGPVIYFKVSKRSKDESINIGNAMREILNKHRETNKIDKQIGMGGIIKVSNGKVKAHIMPDFSKTKLETDEQVNDWLNFFEMGPDLVMFSTFITGDPSPNKNMHLRLEHTHFHSTKRTCHEGGHYHHDVSNDIEYEGYLNIAEYIYRIEDAEYNIKNETPKST